MFATTETIEKKFDPKSDNGIFFGYSTNNPAYPIFNKRTWVVMRSINVIIKETNDGNTINDDDDDDTVFQLESSSSEIGGYVNLRGSLET